MPCRKFPKCSIGEKCRIGKVPYRDSQKVSLYTSPPYQKFASTPQIRALHGCTVRQLYDTSVGFHLCRTGRLQKTAQGPTYGRACAHRQGLVQLYYSDTARHSAQRMRSSTNEAQTDGVRSLKSNSILCRVDRDLCFMKFYSPATVAGASVHVVVAVASHVGCALSCMLRFACF